MTFEVLESTEGYVVAVWRRLMLLIWRGQPSAAGIDRSQVLFAQWAATLPDGAATLVVVPRQLPGPPDEQTRAAMVRAAQSPSPALRGVGTLLEAEGFVAASVRAIVSRIQQRRTGGVAPKVFRTVGEAAAWASDLLGDPELTEGGLAEAIAAARA